jgi:hypothetical protein
MGMSRLLKIPLFLLALLVLALGPHRGGPRVWAEDSVRSERSDLNLSRDDRGELWEEDSHEAAREHHREREYNRDRETEREGRRETGHDREMERDREREQEHDSIREQSRDRDTEHESTSDTEKHGD